MNACKRYRNAFACCVALVLGTDVAPGEAIAQTIDLRLGLTFDNPSNPLSGGTFELAARSSGGGGIAGLVTRIEGIAFSPLATPALNRPEVFGWLVPIPTLTGPIPPIIDRGGGVTELLFAQDVSQPAADLVFEIGHGAGTPGEQGPDLFATGFDNAALLATGAFAPGKVPRFSRASGSESAGNLFVSETRRATMPGDVNEFVASNLLGVPGDYNNDGLVNAADYTVWQDTSGGTTNLAADGTGDRMVDASDYLVWRYFYDSSGVESTAFVRFASIPEPQSVSLVIAVMFSLIAKPTRFMWPGLGSTHR